MLDLIAWRAQKSPDKPAVHFNGRWYTYSEMNKRANRMANRLLDLGLRAGDRVSVLALNHLVHLDLLLAAPKIAVIYAPLNFRLSIAELQLQVRRIQPALLFVDTRSQPVAESLSVPWTQLFDYRAWLNVGSELPPPALARPLQEDDPWMILFTSGTSAGPKAAVLPYRQVLLNARSSAEAWGLRDTDTTLQCTPCFHSSLNVLALPLLYKAGRIVLMSKFDPDEYLGGVALHKTTHLFLSPSNYQTLTQHYDFKHANFASVKWAITGGAPCPETVVQRYRERGVRMLQGYGLTEAGVNCFATTLREPDAPDGSLGSAMPNMDIQIRRDDGSPAAVGEVGEMFLSGPMVFSGYWLGPKHIQSPLEDGWFPTGDLAAMNSIGHVRLMGRKKDLYISGGEKIFPEEVEAALANLPGVLECAVVGVPDATWGEVGLAAIVPMHGETMDPEMLRNQLRSALAGYKLPKHIHFLRSLPRSAAGKVLKSELLRLLEGPVTSSYGRGYQHPAMGRVENDKL